MEKTAQGLIEYAKAQLGRPYWYGTFGQAASKALYDQKKNQYPRQYEWEYDGATAKVHDCVGLIKGYSWYDIDTDRIVYVSNGHPDIGADRLYSDAQEKGPMSTMPEIPGLILHAEGHVGIYIGGGYAIEAMGTRYGVVKTRVDNRSWTGWCKSPYITYIEEAEIPEESSGGL